MTQLATINLNIKTIIEKTKKGLTLESIAEHFHMDPQEFEITMKKKFGEKKANELLDNIHKNNKKRNSPRKKNGKNPKKSSDQNSDWVIPEVKPSIIEEKPEETPKFFISELLDLIHSTESEIGILTSDIFANERKRKSCLSRRNSRKKDIEQIIEELYVIKEALKTKRERYNSLIALSDQDSKEASDFYQIIKEKSQELDKVNERLSALKKITILVLKNGQIQDENGNEIVYSKEEKDISYQMFYNEKMENLTLKEARQFQELISLIKVLKENGISYEILFDSSALEAAFANTDIL